MKRKGILSAAMALAVCFAFVACSDTDDETPPPEVEYTVSYAAGGGAGEGPAAATVAAGTVITVEANTFTYEGYDFDGWQVEGDATKYTAGDSYTVNADTVFTATWSESGQPEVKYTVSYEAGEGTGEAPASVSVTVGTVITVEANTFTRAGFNFDGWKIGEGETKYAAGDSYTVIADTVFTATWEEIKYTVSYEAGEGTGEGPAVVSVVPGTEITVEANTFTYAGFDFDGWKIGEGETKYAAGDSYTVNADTVFTATWTVAPSRPSFSQERYVYDKLGGGDLELPFDLDGSALHYVRFGGDFLDADKFGYDAEKGVIVIYSDFVYGLSLKTYTVVAVTDSAYGERECTVAIEQSLKTSFDEVTQKHFSYGSDEGVRFEVGFNRTTPMWLKQGKVTVPEKYYSYDATGITVSAEWLSLSSASDYTLELSNHDRYDFSVTTDVIFSTDYDLFTVHSTVQSNIGHNPLYQYYDEVSIVDSPSEMDSGKALKITPYNGSLNCYLTLRTPECSYMWYEVPFGKGKVYYITFDYMTVNTHEGDLLHFRGTDSSDAKQVDMLVGADNDNKVHRFDAIYSYTELGLGVRINATFAPGGVLYVDNYKIVELGGAPSIGDGEYDAEGNYKLGYDAYGYRFDVELDGAPIDYTYNASSKEMTFAADDLSSLALGEHVVSIRTPFIVFTHAFRVTDKREATIANSTYTFDTHTMTELKVTGSFDDTIELLSLKQKAKEYYNDYGNNFTELNDTTTNFASRVSLTTGKDGSGYITMPKAFLDKFWGDVTFIAEFDNGQSAEFTVSIPDVLMFTNYDESTIHGKNTALHSGLGNNSVYGIEERESGNKALYIRATQESEDARSAFTVRFHQHVWSWYTATNGKEGEWYRITFDYQISNLEQSEVYYYVMSPADEDRNATYLGDYDRTWFHERDRYYKMIYDLTADGQVHTFDSGWFIWDDPRMARMVLPAFTTDDNAFVMVDNYRVERTSGKSNVLDRSYEYDINDGEAFTLDAGGETAISLTVGDTAVEFTQSAGTITVAADVMATLKLGTFEIVLRTNGGAYRSSVTVSNSYTLAEFTETTVEFKTLSQSEVRVHGSFTPEVTLTSLKQKAKVYRNDYGNNFTELNDTTTNFASRVSFVTGENGAGYIALPKAFLDKFWGEVTFIAEFGNGASAEFTVNNSQVLMFTNYDESTIHGDDTALHSGLKGNSVYGIEERESGNKALYIRSDEKAVANSAFTVRFHQHVWGWYTATNGSEGEWYRITFDYQISNLAQGSVYYYVMSPSSRDLNATMFGDYDRADLNVGDQYYSLCNDLITDGQVHTYDSGWFNWANPRMARMVLPSFTTSDNAFVMVDNYRILRTDNVPYILESVDGYTKGIADTVSFDAAGRTVLSVKIGDTAIGFAQNGNTVTLDSEDLDAFDFAGYTLVVKTDDGTYKKVIAVTDARKSVLKQTRESVVHGQTAAVKLLGEFDPTLAVLSVKRKGSDTWDTSHNTPVEMSSSHVTVAADGLILSSALVDAAYGTTVYYVAFDNGKTVEFELTSNLIYYSNYDETRIFETNQGNVGTCQDTAMWKIVGEGGNNRLEYTPSNTSQGHASSAINGNGADNGILTFSVEGRNGWWKRYTVAGDRPIIISFDYEIVAPEGKSPNFTFVWFGDGNARNEERLLNRASGAKGNFYLEIPAGVFSATYICCPASSPAEVEGCTMYIDNYYFGYKTAAPTDARTAYLEQSSANVVYGEAGDLKLAGGFDTTLAIKSFTRSGTDEWDSSRTVPVEIDRSLIEVAADGMTVKRALIDRAYATTTYTVTFDNDKRVQFKLTSNLLYFTNYDDTCIFDTRAGNIQSCQDTAMWSLAEGEGGKHLEYRPERAVQPHSVNAIHGTGDDNAIFTYKSPSRADANWMIYDFAVGKKMVFFFDYVVDNPNNAEHNIVFYVRRKSDSKYIGEKIDGSGRFELVLDYDIDTIMITCGVSSPDKVSDVCLKLDNFGFGIVE